MVLEGLQGGEKVIVEGFQKFAPGDKVKPRPWPDGVEGGGLPPKTGANMARD